MGEYPTRLNRQVEIPENALHAGGLRNLEIDGAQEGTRTLTPYGTRPSNVCVYQFHHLSIYIGEGLISGIPKGLSSPEIGF